MMEQGNCKKWQKKDDEFLIKNYKLLGKKELMISIDKSWCAIQKRASKFGIKKINIINKENLQKIWEPEEVEYLIYNYKDTEKSTIITTLSRTWESIQQKAAKLKIRREIENANQLKLVSGSKESLYWIGFCMADGHFNEKNKQLQINLSIKDIAHLRLFSNFIGHSKVITKPSLNISINKIWSYLYEKYKIHHRKTYVPCDLSKLTDDELICVAIGFIDGDGTVSKKGYIVIKVHESWEDNVKRMICVFTKKFNKEYKISHSGNLIVGRITDIEITKYIKKLAIELNLPILKRKWDKISLSKLSQRERRLDIFETCKRFYNKGCSVKEIKGITNLSSSVIYKNFKIIKELYTY